MTNGELFFKTFPCLEQDEKWPNLLWWTDEKGKRQLLGDVYDSYFWDEKYKGPTTKNDLGVDCVSRQFMYDLGATCIAYRNDKQELIPIISIDELPSVTPQEPKKGHWITRPHVYGVTYCSECDFELKIDDTNYCPNCGAKMVDPQESESEE